MQHIEFFHIDHFEKNYHRAKPAPELESFIDFFWETKFDELLQQYPDGFSDALFPNIGYTYLINLGTPFVMQVGDKKFDMKTDGFLPRNNSIECYHRKGNKLFGIKFKISPIIFKTRVDFSEYREYIYPLSYLMEQSVIDGVKKAGSFDERTDVLNRYFKSIIENYSGSWEAIRIVSEILQHCNSTNDFTTTVEEFAARYKISERHCTVILKLLPASAVKKRCRYYASAKRPSSLLLHHKILITPITVITITAIFANT